MNYQKLFMVLLGGTPKARNTEQHDVFFGIGTSLKELITDMTNFWPEAKNLHVDAWREVTEVDGFKIEVSPKEPDKNTNYPAEQLFFLNLGGYKPDSFDEFHYRMLAVAKEKSEAIRQAKKTAFYKHTGFAGAVSHIDDKYGIDIDDIYQINDILPSHAKVKYSLVINPEPDKPKDEWHLGYLTFSRL